MNARIVRETREALHMSRQVSAFKIGVNPLGPTDRRVPVLKVAASDGDAEGLTAVVFGYACHCTTLGADMMRVHGDYAGIAADAIERAHPGAVALFLTGCGADANPYPRGRLAQATVYGGQLADAVEAVLAGKELRPLSGSLRIASTFSLSSPSSQSAASSRTLRWSGVSAL